MKYIGVFCSANELADAYTVPAKEFAKLLPQHNYHLVWGGSDEGLMRVIASGVQEGGGQIIGVSMELLKHKVRKSADEVIVAKDLAERKATILKRSDALVVLVGGIGTLDEITEVLELKKHGIHNKPIIILNTKNYYKGLKEQLETMEEHGFLTKRLDALIYFAETPEDVIGYLNKHRAA